MKRTKNYAPPMIIKQSRVYTETAILAGSVAEKATVTIDAAEQKVENYNFGGSDFNHNWE